MTKIVEPSFDGKQFHTIIGVGLCTKSHFGLDVSGFAA